MTEYSPVSPFAEDNPSGDLTIQVTRPRPGSAAPMGPIESMKRALMVALREALTGTALSLNSSQIKVSMEYPMTKAKNPGIWVQFSYTNLDRAGIDHERTVKVNDKWVTIQEWIYYGRTSLTIVAYTSVERDRLADAFIQNIAFARTPDRVMTKTNEDTKQFRSFITALNENPYVNLTVSTDSLQPGGPGMSVGTPWDDNQFVYEDTYSFESVGQFQCSFSEDGSFELTDIQEVRAPLEAPEPGWSAWV